MPKQWIFITLYIVFIYLVIHGLIIYARTHPLEDARTAPASSERDDKALDSALQPQ